MLTDGCVLFFFRVPHPRWQFGRSHSGGSTGPLRLGRFPRLRQLASGHELHLHGQGTVLQETLQGTAHRSGRHLPGTSALIPQFTGFYWVLLGSTGFYLVLLVFSWIHRCTVTGSTGRILGRFLFLMAMHYDGRTRYEHGASAKILVESDFPIFFTSLLCVDRYFFKALYRVFLTFACRFYAWNDAEITVFVECLVIRSINRTGIQIWWNSVKPGTRQ